jgi:DNA-binding PadR family transcriptional regulator
MDHYTVRHALEKLEKDGRVACRQVFNNGEPTYEYFSLGEQKKKEDLETQPLEPQESGVEERAWREKFLKSCDEAERKLEQCRTKMRGDVEVLREVLGSRTSPVLEEKKIRVWLHYNYCQAEPWEAGLPIGKITSTLRESIARSKEEKLIIKTSSYFVVRAVSDLVRLGEMGPRGKRMAKSLGYPLEALLRISEVEVVSGKDLTPINVDDNGFTIEEIDKAIEDQVHDTQGISFGLDAETRVCEECRWWEGGVELDKCKAPTPMWVPEDISKNAIIRSSGCADDCAMWEEK